jgi:hypothetical protein
MGTIFGLLVFGLTGEQLLTLCIWFVGIGLAIILLEWMMGNLSAPLPQRSLSRATCSAFVLTFVTVALMTVRLDPLVTKAALALGGVALFLLVVGARNSGGTQVDTAVLVLWGAAAVCFAWLRFAMVHPAGLTAFYRALLAALYCAGCVACLVRVGLLLRPGPSATLPDPATVPGMPMAGPASVAAAQAAMSRRGSAARPKFRT